jgi:hypothetical protein
MKDIEPMNDPQLPEILRELAVITKGKASRWRQVAGFSNVAYLPDGSIEANGNDEWMVARAILRAEVSRATRRRESAKRAAETRAKRREKQLYRLVKHIRDGGQFTPAHKCRLCGKSVEDAESVSRGIGPDCWQTILRELEQLVAATSDNQPPLESVARVMTLATDFSRYRTFDDP